MMKKLLFITLLGFGIQSLVIAQGSNYRSGEFIHVSESDSLQNQLIAAGQTVEILGWLGNDFFSAAELLSINGTVTDDAIVAARRITVGGTIGDLLMGAAEMLIIDGQISGDIFVAGRKVRVTDNAHIQGNVYIVAASFIFEGGTIEGRLRAAADEINMNGIILNKANLYGNNFTFGSNYEAINGTDITSDEPINREELGQIPDNLNIMVSESRIWPGIIFKIGFYLSLLVTGLILMRVFQRTAIDIYHFSVDRYIINTGVGLLSFILWPLLMFLFMLLILTIPFSIILMVLYGLALFISYLLVAMILGVLSIQFFRDQLIPSMYYWGFAIGLLFIAILVNLPYLGWVFSILLLFFGLGSLVYYFWVQRTITAQKKPLSETGM